MSKCPQKCYLNHYAFCGTASFSSLQNAREAAIAFIKYQVEVENALTDIIYIKDQDGEVVETVNAYSIYGDDFDFSKLTVSVVF